MPKRIIFVFLSCMLASCSAGGRVRAPADGPGSMGPALYSIGDDPAWSDPAFDDSAWSALEIPATIPLRSSDGYFWIRTSASLSRDLPDQPVWFESGKIECAFELYAGGTYIGSRGIMPPRYSARSQLDSVILIPATAFTDGQASLALRCYYSGTQALVPGFRLADAERALLVNYLMTFLISTVNLFIAVLCLFMGLYFLAGFISRTSETASLYYALSLFFVAIYFMDMGTVRIMLGGHMQRAVARVCLSASMAFTLLFFVKYFGARRYKLAKIAAALQIGVFGVLFIVFARDDAAVNLLFNLSLLPVFSIIVIVCIIIVRASRKGQREAIPIFFGMAVGLGFAIHDIIYQVLGAKPFAWLQGFTFFSLNLSIFIAMSLRSSYMRKELDDYTKAVSEQRDKLSNLLCEAERAAEETTTVARLLDDEVAIVASAAERSAEGAAAIDMSSEAQRRTLETANAEIRGLLASIAKVKAELEAEAISIERTARNTGSLMDGVARVGDAVDGTATFASSLDKLTASGREAMARLSGSMEKVRNSSKEIRSVVEAVNEFADQTNLLAMNASIEAAHAGAAGKGFGVIAHEIKRLAQASSDRSSTIGAIVAGIESAVGEGLVDSASVSDALASISDGAARTSARVSEAAAEASRQRVAGDDIAAESRALAASAVKMMEEASRQALLSENASRGLGDLEAGQVAVIESSSMIVARTAELSERVAILRSIAARARKASEDLVQAMSR